jgi:hypothetical protein
MVAYDEIRVMRNPQWSMVIPTVQSLLGGATEAVEPFIAAWSLLYAAISRLDYLQDGDPVDDPLPTDDRPSAHYNVLLGYYILAESLLDLLSPDDIPIHRILRLRGLWTHMVLRMASGQQRDLITPDHDSIDSPLDFYQELVQSKTGATFALALGGLATLLSDDQKMIDTLTLIGEIYGTFLQYSDDLLDVATQPNSTLTLSKALAGSCPAQESNETAHTPEAFWGYLYRLYRRQVESVLADMPISMQQGILDLFARTFE